MNSNSSSTSSSKDISPWSEHALQITTPQDKYLGNNGTSTDKRLRHVGPPLSRFYHSSSMASSPSGDIYIFGGWGGRFMNDTWAIRISGDSHLPLGPGRNPEHMRMTASLVETTGETPSPRFGHQSALVNGLLIVWRGTVDGKGGPPDDNSVYALNITTCHWTKLDIQPAPSARAWYSACVCGSKFIVFGGELEAGEYMNDLWGLDLDSITQGTPKWERIVIAPGSGSPSKRTAPTVVAYREKLYVFGGLGNKTEYNDTWCFDMTTRVWAELKCTGPIPPPRSSHAVALVGDAMYIFGGVGKGAKIVGDTWSFKIHEQRWYRFPSMDSVPAARRGHILATIHGCVLLVGGVWGNPNKYGYFERVHILDADRIDYPEKGEEITLKPTLRIEQSGSIQITETLEGDKHADGGISEGSGQKTKDIAFGAIEDRSDGLEADGMGMSELAMTIDSIRPEKIDNRSVEVNSLDTAIAVPAFRDTITGAMSATEILHYLVLHGCRDISKELDVLRVSEYPVARGGFGDVYCATLRNGDRVGLKCIHILLGSTDEGKKFLKHAAHELYVWSKCQHPNILELHGVMLFRDQLAMVSPWVEHGHLRWFLSQNPQANRCALCVDIADGVDYMHKQGMVHGDLKPENILVAEGNVPKLTDFGNAALSEYTLQFSQTTTAQGMSMRWTAPEILNEETKATQGGDVYALGMIIFEVFTGILPYDGVRESVIMRRILAGKVPSRPQSHIPSGVAQADRLWSMIMNCWAFEREERPKAWEVKYVMEGITPEGLLANRS